MASNTQTTPNLLSIKQAARLTGVCERTLRRRIAEGRLPAYRIGPRAIRVKAADLDRLLEPIPTGDAA